MLNQNKVSNHIQLANWIFESHSWEETLPGILKCKWCKKTHLSNFPISAHASLCERNPAVVILTGWKSPSTTIYEL